MTPITLTLPYPPSVNSYWDWTPRGLKLSDRARDYHLMCVALVRQQRPQFTRGEKLLGALACHIQLFPPELKRKRDADNALKALFDGMQHAGVYEDDNQIEIFSVRRGEPSRHGYVRVEIRRLS